MIELNKNDFTNENYSPYGNVQSLIYNKDFDRVIGYSYTPEYFTQLNYGGILFINNFGKIVWNEVPYEYLDKVKDLDQYSVKV